MFALLIDLLNNTSGLRKKAEVQYPSERIIYSSAAVFLVAPEIPQPGFTLRRLLQQRGNVVITDRRILIGSALSSVAGAFWTLAVLFFGFGAMLSPTLVGFLFVVFAFTMLLQRRPFFRDIPRAAMAEIIPGSAGGALGNYVSLDISLADYTIQVVPSRPVPEEIFSGAEQNDRGLRI